RDAIPVLLLAQQREQQAEHRRKVFLDVGRDDAAYARARLDGLHARVEASQRDDGLDAVIAQRTFELVLGIGRIERGDDRAELPRREFSDRELRAVRQQQCHAVAALDAEGGERRRARVAQALELA